ncbi:NUDIX domain-containing protein [Streptomyces cavernae]|uniref:NUDIX domain-containing protein n=1 Tax=Streptomyces cavernae TaxID=2259034 RepID=UPI000FEBFECB|nr:NUDIX domain-containing protein [Streptomyces cavernae]
MGESVERVDERDRVVGVVDRAQAVRSEWLRRVAITVCRDVDGRVLVHRRADGVARFPGQYDWLVGGAAGVGESYEQAVARGVFEELGGPRLGAVPLQVPVPGAMSPYWLGVHEAVPTEGMERAVRPDPAEISWHSWMTGVELRAARREWAFVPDGQEVFRRCAAADDDPGRCQWLPLRS